MKILFFVNFIILGDVLTGDSNGNIFVWGRGYNAVTKVSIIRTITFKSNEVNKLCIQIEKIQIFSDFKSRIFKKKERQKNGHGRIFSYCLLSTLREFVCLNITLVKVRLGYMGYCVDNLTGLGYHRYIGPAGLEPIPYTF